jgi:hypothetical protein
MESAPISHALHDGLKQELARADREQRLARQHA